MSSVSELCLLFCRSHTTRTLHSISIVDTSLEVLHCYGCRRKRPQVAMNVHSQFSNNGSFCGVFVLASYFGTFIATHFRVAFGPGILGWSSSFLHSSLAYRQAGANSTLLHTVQYLRRIQLWRNQKASVKL